MKQRTARLVSILLILLLTIGTVGCAQKQDAPPEQLPGHTDGISTFDLASEASQETFAPPASPTPVLSASERFQALDLAFFRDYVTDEGYTFHQMVKDPEVFSIDQANVLMTLGDFSEEANQIKCDEYAQYLGTLLDIPREELTVREQTAYDVLQHYLENTIDDGQFAYFFEPLTKAVGIQTNLPLSFALYSFHTEEDVKAYLALLSDVPRYLGQIMVYEQARAERGLFMTEQALDAVLGDLNEIIHAGEKLFLFDTFSYGIGQLSTLSASAAKAYVDQNAQLMRSAFLPSYEMLRDGLESLRPFCRASEGMYAEGDSGLAYFELRMQEESGVLLSADEALELLETTLNRMTIDASYIYMQDPSVFQETHTVTTGDTDSDIAFLEQLSAEVLGPLPNHLLAVDTIPDELQKQMSAAAYVIPAIDELESNTVLLNPSVHSEQPLFTLAHETYFGHLYQYVQNRANGELPLLQQVLPHSGLSEGFAQVGTEIMLKTQNQFDSNYCKVYYYNSILKDTLLPAIVSILINYKAYDNEQIAEYLTQFGYSDPAYAAAYTAMALDMPFYTFRYAIGYSMLSDMLLGAENELGDAFDQSAYLQKLLDIGPAPFHLLREQMDVWTDAQIAE